MGIFLHILYTSFDNQKAKPSKGISRFKAPVILKSHL